MAGFSSYDDLINEMTTNGKRLEWWFAKTSSAPEAAGAWHSLWTAAGSPGVGATPATTPGTSYTDTAGTMNWGNQSPDQKHIVSVSVTATQNCSLMIYDRLVAVSGLSVASTGNRTVSSTTLPRYTAANSGVQAWLEVTTATTTTAAVVSMNSYTNDDSSPASGRTGGNITFPAAATNIDAMVGPLPLQVGDKGVSAVSTINVGTAAASGVVNLVLVKPLVFIPLIANIANHIDFVLQLASLPRVYDGASLAMAYQATGTTATSFFGNITLAYG